MTVFELSKIKLENLNYPLRKTYKRTLGVYSSLDKAYEALQEFVAEEDSKYTMGYIVEERVLDASYWKNVIISTYTYTKYGTLNDGCVWTDENNPGGYNPFYGRPKEEIRFKLGDIVEVCQGNESELQIICHTPTSTEEFERYKARWEKEGKLPENGTYFDSTDNNYLTYSIGIGDTHGHPMASDVFAPTKKVPTTIKRKLQGKLLEQVITGGHRVQISELPFAKDPKVIDEVLSNWEKLVKPKIYKEKKWVYEDMVCLVDYTDADTIKSRLNFSEKQAQRFDRFYKACVRLVNEKREKSNQIEK